MREGGENESRGNGEREGRKKIGGIRNQMCMRVKRKREETKERKRKGVRLMQKKRKMEVKRNTEEKKDEGKEGEIE